MPPKNTALSAVFLADFSRFFKPATFIPRFYERQLKRHGTQDATAFQE